MGMTDRVIRQLKRDESVIMPEEEIRIIATCLAHAAYPDATYNNWAFDKWNRFVPKPKSHSTAARALVNQVINHEVSIDDCCWEVFGISRASLPVAVRSRQKEWLEANPHGQQKPVPIGCSVPILILICLIASLLICTEFGGI